MRAVLRCRRPCISKKGFCVSAATSTNATCITRRTLTSLTLPATLLRRSACNPAVALQQQQQYLGGSSTISIRCSAPWCLCARRGYHDGGRSANETQNGAEGRDNTKVSEDASDLLWSSLEEDTTDVSTKADDPSLSFNSKAAEAPSGESVSASRSRQRRDEEEEKEEAVKDSEERGGVEEADVSSSRPVYAWVTLHNPPRNWMHEDIIEFIHHVAKHAGITAPTTSLPSAHPVERGEDSHGAEDIDQRIHHDSNEDGNEGMMTSPVTSPFVHHLHIPFGRRTGLMYGSPKLCLSSASLATYLVKDLTFDADDFRNRIYFTKLAPSEVPMRFQQQQQRDEGSTTADGFAQVRYTPIEETMAHEQDEALRTLELDRYLFAPDLLLDIAKSHQRRLVTKNEKVLLDAFVDGEEDAEDDHDDGEGDGEGEDDEKGSVGKNAGEVGMAGRTRRSTSAASRRRRRGAGASTKKAARSTRVRAGTQKHLGRGSMHNMPIPKPYVEGRKL